MFVSATLSRAALEAGRAQCAPHGQTTKPLCSGRIALLSKFPKKYNEPARVNDHATVWPCWREL